MRRFGVALILPWLTLTVNAQGHQDWRVRSSDPYFIRLLDEGYARSATFRSLVERLNDSDIIVYVRRELTSRSGRRGHLRSDIVVAGRTRYLEVRVNPRGSPKAVLALVAHELQHAVEVAEGPAVRNEDTFEKHFSRIGFSCGHACFETMAAERTQLAVAKELGAR